MNSSRLSQKYNPILAVGIDVAGPEFIEKLSRNGTLSTIGSLMKHGSWGKILSTSDISSGSIWPSFYTGTSPAKHGQAFTHMQFVNGTYHIDKKYADQVRRDPFWVLLNRAGKRIGIVDLPQTFPIQGMNGIQIVGWGAEYPAWKRSSWPPNLMNDILARFGPHPLAHEYRLSIKPKTKQEYENLVSKLLLGAERKGAITKYLLERQTWDCFLTVFPESHWAMHLLWQTLDESHPDYDSNIIKGFEDVFLRLFSSIDTWISKFVEIIPDATVLIFSLSGMGANYSGWHLLPEVLQRMGMTTDNSPRLMRSSELFLPMKRWGAYKIRRVEDSLSLNLIEKAKKIVPRRLWDKWTRRILYAGNNWEESLAFCIPNDYSGAIRINLKGREPNGKVEPGKQFDHICHELIRELSALINPETGENAVSRVFRIDELYEGEHLYDLPDLIVCWANDGPIKALYSPRIGTIRGESPERRTGAHRPYGFSLASGVPIQRGKMIKDGSIMDIAPTILYLMGQPIPRDMDGKVLLDIIDEEFKANNPPTYV